MTIDYQHVQAEQYNYDQHYSGFKTDGYYLTKANEQIDRPLASQRFRALDLKQLEGLEIKGYSFNKGGFKGEGLGTAFFALSLTDKDNKINPWIIVTIASGGRHHMLLDGKWIQTFRTSVEIFKPLLEPWWIQGYNSKIDKDDLTPFLKDCVIKSVDLQQNHCNITFTKDGQDHLLEILNTDPRLCPWPGATYKVGKEIRYALPKAFPEGEHMGDYIALIPEDGLIYV